MYVRVVREAEGKAGLRRFLRFLTSPALRSVARNEFLILDPKRCAYVYVLILCTV